MAHHHRLFFHKFVTRCSFVVCGRIQVPYMSALTGDRSTLSWSSLPSSSHPIPNVQRKKKSKEGTCIVVASTKRPQAGRDISGKQKAENQELTLIFTYSKGRTIERDTDHWLGHFQTWVPAFFPLSASFTQRWSWLRRGYWRRMKIRAFVPIQYSMRSPPEPAMWL